MMSGLWARTSSTSIVQLPTDARELVGEEDVRGGDELVEDVESVGRGQVEGQALLAPVGVLEQDVDVLGHDGDAGRCQPPHGIAPLDVLDLDDLGPPVRQQRRCRRDEGVLGHFEDAYALQISLTARHSDVDGHLDAGRPAGGTSLEAGRPGRVERSLGMPRTRSLITLRAISVVPPPMVDTWRIRKSAPQLAMAPSSSVQAPASPPANLECDGVVPGRDHPGEQPADGSRLVGHGAGPQSVGEAVLQRLGGQLEHPGFADEVLDLRVIEPAGAAGDPEHRRRRRRHCGPARPGR